MEGVGGKEGGECGHQLGTAYALGVRFTGRPQQRSSFLSKIVSPFRFALVISSGDKHAPLKNREHHRDEKDLLIETRNTGESP